MDTILKEYGELLASVDQWFGRCSAHAGGQITCNIGCSGCCRGLFDITLLDAFYLKNGFDALDAATREHVLLKCRQRFLLFKDFWPEFDAPYILNYRPEEEWEILMPEEDETPCPLLGDDGKCLVYLHRPMTCRLHGVPLIDVSGDEFYDEWCTLNFTGKDPLCDIGLRGEFDLTFRKELRLFRRFTEKLLGRQFNELDTFIPTALLIDFAGFGWKDFAANVQLQIATP